jgi:hypothetical protein
VLSIFPLRLLPVTNHLCGAGTAPHIIYADSAGCCAFATLIDKSRSGRGNSARFVDSGKNNVGKIRAVAGGLHDPPTESRNRASVYRRKTIKDAVA